jgi:hypothetical protein
VRAEQRWNRKKSLHARSRFPSFMPRDYGRANRTSTRRISHGRQDDEQSSKAIDAFQMLTHLSSSSVIP